MESKSAQRVRFADWLADQLATRRDATSMELAANVGVLDGDVENWLGGRAVPTPEECRQVAEYFGLSLTEVIQLCGDPAGQG